MRNRIFRTQNTEILFTHQSMELSAGAAASQQQAGGDWINLQRPDPSWDPLDPVQEVGQVPQAQVCEGAVPQFLPAAVRLQNQHCSSGPHYAINTPHFTNLSFSNFYTHIF